MRYEHSQILNLLSAGRIDAAEAERLLTLTGLTSSFSQRLLAWAPVLILAAILLLQHSADVSTALQFLTVRAAEAARLEHFHAIL
jgi:hypothetical protein